MLPHHHLRRQVPPPDAGAAAAAPVALPLVVSLNCLEECLLEQDSLAGLAAVEHVGLGRIADGRIESAAAVLLHSLAFLPRAAQRRLQPWQLLLCLGSADRAVDSALAADLGLRLVHVDVCRAEEVADSVMALFLGLLRKTHLLSRQTFSTSGWLGSVQPLCRGMRRCRGLVLGIVGRSASARSLATKSLAFKLSVLYFDVYEENGKTGHAPIMFPPAARRMDTLNDLLAASDLVSLHCALTNNTIQIINADSLQHIKPRAYIVNTGSSQLIDDCALKQLLIDGTISGCALDGAEGPQWMEAWVKEMPNVLILPRSADYSEEVWMEIREKAISVLQSFFVDGVFPADAVSDEEDGISEIAQDDDDRSIKKEIESSSNINYANLQKDESQSSIEDHQKHGASNPSGAPVQSQTSDPSKGTPVRSEGKHSRLGKKAKRRQSRRKSQQKSDDQLFEGESNCTSQREDENVNGRDQVLSSSSRFASPEDLRSRQTGLGDSAAKSTRANKAMLSVGPVKRSDELLKDGYVIALLASDESGFHVSRQRVRGGGWFLDVMSNVTRKDPAAQFLVVFKDKDTIGLRSFAAGGKLLQINRRMEFVFASHSFDVCESWLVEGSSLHACKLVNSRNPTATLEVQIQILAAVSEEDGVTRWIN